MGVTDALCKECKLPMRWGAVSPMYHPACDLTRQSSTKLNAEVQTSTTASPPQPPLAATPSRTWMGHWRTLVLERIYTSARVVHTFLVLLGWR